MLTEHTINTLIQTLMAVNPALLAGGLSIATLLFVSSPRFAILKPVKQKIRSLIINTSSIIGGLASTYVAVPLLGLIIRGFLTHNPLTFASILATGSLAAINNPRHVLRYSFKLAAAYLTGAYKTGHALGKAASTSMIDDNLIVTSCQAFVEESKNAVLSALNGEPTPVVRPEPQLENTENSGLGIMTQFYNYTAGLRNPFAGYRFINREQARINSFRA